MATIAWISAATVAGGVISIAVAALFALSAPASWVPALVSFAIGTLLGAVFLEILPHAIGSTGNLQTLFATVLAGILGFFVLEKLVLWRHCHIEDCEAHDHHADPSDSGRSGLMIIIGDGFHNFVDGILIAAASMIYVAVADLIPGLHRRPELHATAQQVALIALGVALIWLVGDVVRAA